MFEIARQPHSFNKKLKNKKDFNTANIRKKKKKYVSSWTLPSRNQPAAACPGRAYKTSSNCLYNLVKLKCPYASHTHTRNITRITGEPYARTPHRVSVKYYVNMLFIYFFSLLLNASVYLLLFWIRYGILCPSRKRATGIIFFLFLFLISTVWNCLKGDVPDTTGSELCRFRRRIN